MVKYKESESESEGAEHAAERFRVRVCMQRFYGTGDVRARAYVCVAPRRRVRWLQRRLRRLFALPPVRLLSRGHLLPPQEPLALLQPDDPVEVVPAVADSDVTTAARDIVDSVGKAEMAPVNEVERSSRPVGPDDLTETKRQALMMLEQYCAEPAAECVAECATNAPRARRRRVRRRRRVPPATAPERSQFGSDADAGSSARADRPGAAPALVLRDELQPRVERLGDALVLRDELEPRVERLGEALVLRDELEPRVERLGEALVLRDELQPRAPRVVRPLADRGSASPLDTLPG